MKLETYDAYTEMPHTVRASGRVEVRATPRLERAIHRVQGLRERLIGIGIELADATDMVVGVSPASGANVKEPPPGPNGLIEALSYNLDLLERDISVIGETVERLREGL